MAHAYNLSTLEEDCYKFLSTLGYSVRYYVFKVQKYASTKNNWQVIP